MTIKQALCMILFGLLVFCSANDDHDFVNPTDLLNFDPVNIRMKNKSPNHVEKTKILTHNDETLTGGIASEGKTPENEPSVSKQSVQSIKDDDGGSVEPKKQCLEMKDLALKPIFKRYVMSLVHHIEDKIESSAVSVNFCMKMQASYDDLLLLKHYGTGSTDNVHEVHDKLDKMFLYVTDLPQEGVIFWLEKKLGLSTNNLLLVIAILLLGLISTRLLAKIRLTRSFIAKMIFFGFIFSTFTTFIDIYQRKVADQEKILTEEVHERCPQFSDTIYSRMKFYVLSAVTFQDENCREYYEAVIVNPLFKVSILEAGSLAFVKTLTSPLKVIGHDLKGFIVGFFKDLPVQFAIYSAIPIVVLVILIPILSLGYTIRIPLLMTLHPPPCPQIEASGNSKAAFLENEQPAPSNQLTDAKTQIDYLQQQVLMLREEAARENLRRLEAPIKTSSEILQLESPCIFKESSTKENLPDLEKIRSSPTIGPTHVVANRILSSDREDLQLTKSRSEGLQLNKSRSENLQLGKYERKHSEPDTDGTDKGKSQSHDLLTSPFVPNMSQDQEVLISGHISPVPKMIMVHGEGDEEPKKHVKEFCSDLVDLAVSSAPSETCGDRNALSNTDFFLTQEER